jgi:hypothetical protein
VSTNSKSFWSTIPGLITGLAGILTGIVGLATLLIQIGVIGGDNGDSPTTTRPGATAAPGAGGGQSDGSDDSGSETTAGRPSFTVAPTSLKLSGSDKTGEVTVSNTGGGAFTVATDVTGSGEDQFTVRRGSCGAEVPRRGSCTMTVEFKGGLGATAELVVTVRGASPSEQRVDLEGSLI